MLSVDLRIQLPDFTAEAAFEAPAGVTALFGRSGAGKTTLINAIAGLVRPASGRIEVGGTVLFDAARGIDLAVQARKVGYVFQDGRLFPHMTVARNLGYGGSVDAERVIAMLGIGPLLGRMPATLSGGERQRVALGRALMSGPRILLMDEPLSALDSERKEEILPYLERLRDETEVPILYVSHDMSEVARLATTLVILDRGKVLRSGPVAEVLSDPASVRSLGVRDAGAVITGTVASYDATDDLSRFVFEGGALILPSQLGPDGAIVRVRVAASDVILARLPPKEISALNVLPVTVTTVSQGRGPGVAVGLQAGSARLLARVTRRSAAALDLKEGQQIFAIIKATAVARRDIGQGG
jgi:molybdate transport system ATP-binding protein